MKRMDGMMDRTEYQVSNECVKYVTGVVRMKYIFWYNVLNVMSTGFCVRVSSLG